MDAHKSLENPELIKAIAAFIDDPCSDSEQDLFHCLSCAQFLLPVQSDKTNAGDDMAHMSLGTTQLMSTLLTGTDPEGFRYFFGFTDRSALQDLAEARDGPTMIVAFDDIAQIVLDESSNFSGFLINPQTLGFFVPREIFRVILKL